MLSISSMFPIDILSVDLLQKISRKWYILEKKQQYDIAEWRLI